MVSEDLLTAAAWTALLEQPPCCVRGCRAWFPKGGTWNQLAPVLRDFGWTSFALGSNKHQSKHRGISLWTLGFHLQNWGISSTFRTRQQCWLCWPDFENNQREVDVLTPKLEFLNMEGFQLDRVLAPGQIVSLTSNDDLAKLRDDLFFWVIGQPLQPHHWVGKIIQWKCFRPSQGIWGPKNLRLYPLGVALYVSWIHGEFVLFFPEKGTERNIYFNGLSENLKGGSKHGRAPAVDLSKRWRAHWFGSSTIQDSCDIGGAFGSVVASNEGVIIQGDVYIYIYCIIISTYHHLSSLIITYHHLSSLIISTLTRQMKKMRLSQLTRSLSLRRASTSTCSFASLLSNKIMSADGWHTEENQQMADRDLKKWIKLGDIPSGSLT